MKRSSRSLSRRFGGFLVTALVTLGLLAGLSACARRDVVELADRQPQLDLAEFFRGDSIAYGIFEDRFGNLRRQFRVNMTGTVEGDTLTLAEDFLYDDGERAERTWVIRNTGVEADGSVRYEGIAADVSGSASGRVAGNALNWEYDVVLECRAAMSRCISTTGSIARTRMSPSTAPSSASSDRDRLCDNRLSSWPGRRRRGAA